MLLDYFDGRCVRYFINRNKTTVAALQESVLFFERDEIHDEKACLL